MLAPSLARVPKVTLPPLNILDPPMQLAYWLYSVTLESRPLEWRSAGTGLCFYRVRGVDGICAEHLTVEFYTVFICQRSYLLLYGIHSFFPVLKPSFSTNLSHCSHSFLST